MPPRLMAHEENPKDIIFKNVGMTKDLQIPGFKLFGNRVLVGIYEMPEKTKSGLYIPDKSRDESLHQGKAAVVLAKGDSAFVSDSEFNFRSDNIEVGDWILLFVMHGMRCAINGAQCRIIRDQDITMKIPAPDQVW